MKKSELIWTGMGISLLILVSLESKEGIEWWQYIGLYLWPLYFIVDGLLSAYLEEHHAILELMWRKLRRSDR